MKQKFQSRKVIKFKPSYSVKNKLNTLMKNVIKSEDSAYKTIGEVAKELGLIDKKTGNLQTHTL